jgi:hypothetical protein
MAKKSGFGLPSIFELGRGQQQQQPQELPPPPKGYKYVPLNAAARNAHPELLLPQDSYAVTPRGTVPGTVPKDAINIPGTVGGSQRYQYKFPAHTPEGIKERAAEHDRLLQQQQELRGLGVKEGGQRATRAGGTSGVPGLPPPTTSTGQPGQPGEQPHVPLSYQLPAVLAMYAGNNPASGQYSDALIKRMMKGDYNLAETVGMDQPFLKTKAGIAYQSKHGYPSYEGEPIDLTDAERRASGLREQKFLESQWKAENPDFIAMGSERNPTHAVATTADYEQPSPTISGPEKYKLVPGNTVPVGRNQNPTWLPQVLAGYNASRMTIPREYAPPDTPPRSMSSWVPEIIRRMYESPPAPPPSNRMSEQPHAVPGMSEAMLTELLSRVNRVAEPLPSSMAETSARAINNNLAEYGIIPRAAQVPVPTPSVSQTPPVVTPESGKSMIVPQVLKDMYEKMNAPPDPTKFDLSNPKYNEQRYDPLIESNLPATPQETPEETHNKLDEEEQ